MSATHPASLTVQVPLSIRRQPGRKTVVTPEGKASAGMPETAIPTSADPALLKALARSFRYQRLLDEGQYASITEMAEAEKLDRGYMGRLLQLTLLAPNLVEAVLDGRQSDQLDLPSLLKSIPLIWEQQGGVRT
ncbi:hypothetical protein [Muricoccus vinaceus]|uniref:Uncharacterized protein n=1 Tax=Muricoccus vinaceus TaxID=424704 RepID=A0ABV6ITC3_9PROT